MYARIASAQVQHAVNGLDSVLDLAQEPTETANANHVFITLPPASKQ